MRSLIFPILVISLISCSGTDKRQNTENEKPVNIVQVPVFNADSAYSFVKKQVDFGSRVPQTPAHKACLEYLKQTLEKYGADVTVQNGSGQLYDGKSIEIKNIIGSFNPEATGRILLCSHWDTRPFADQDKDYSKHRNPIPGANDGASGVGVLLEVARNLRNLPENLGIDIIFFDVEDYGVPEFYMGNHDADTWCLGSTYWAKNPHKINYKADYGILLDMVGASAATFYQEYYSLDYARHIVENVWNTAQKLGFEAYFIAHQGGAIMDDHLPINRFLKIPCIDIIQLDRSSSTGFAQYWHTTDDNMNNIDRNTLYAVGTTILHLVYK
jgi:hypothetical protein